MMSLRKLGEELWVLDGSYPEDDYNFLIALCRIHKPLQDTANNLRKNSLPYQRVTRVKTFIEHLFQKKGGNMPKLKKLDCDVLKFIGLSFTVKQIERLTSLEIKVLETQGPDFFDRRKDSLTNRLYQADINNAIRVKGLEEDESYGEFIKGTTHCPGPDKC